MDTLVSSTDSPSTKLKSLDLLNDPSTKLVVSSRQVARSSELEDGPAGDSLEPSTTPNKKDAEERKEVLSSALAQYWDDRPVVAETDEDQTDEELGREYWGEDDWDALSEERKEESKKSQQKIELGHARYLRRSARAVLRDVHVLDPDPADQPLVHTVIYRPVSRQVDHDPWPSEWRAKVAEVVLGPSINKTNAKNQYKVSDQELLGLKERTDNLEASRTSTWYYRAAVEALSLRSHGGINGHAEHLAKLEARKEKTHATRVKNGTVEPSYLT